jgi:hypothetical protein
LLNSDEKKRLELVLNKWITFSAITADSIAVVFRTLGNLKFSPRNDDEGELLGRIIAKYLDTEYKSPSSIANFLGGLYAIDYHKLVMTKRTRNRLVAVLQLTDALKEANIEDYAEIMYQLSGLDFQWDELPDGFQTNCLQFHENSNRDFSYSATKKLFTSFLRFLQQNPQKYFPELQKMVEELLLRRLGFLEEDERLFRRSMKDYVKILVEESENSGELLTRTNVFLRK